MNRYGAMIALAFLLGSGPEAFARKAVSKKAEAKEEACEPETVAEVTCAHDYQMGPWEPGKAEISLCRQILKREKLDAIKLYSALWTIGRAQPEQAKRFLPELQALLKRQVKAKLRIDLGDGTNSSLWGVAAALEKIGPPAAAALPDLKSAYGLQKKAGERVTVATTIAAISPSAGLPLLLKELHPPGHLEAFQESETGSILFNLGRFGGKTPKVMATISRYVLDGVWFNSRVAIESLVMLENPKAVPHISAGFGSGSWRVVLAAVRGLEAYGALSLPEAPKLAAVATLHWSNRVRLEAARVYQELTGEALPVAVARFDPPPCLKADGRNASVLVGGEEIPFHNYFTPPEATGEMPPDGGFPEMEPAHWARVPIYGGWTPLHPVDGAADEILQLKRRPKNEMLEVATTYPVADKGWLLGYSGGEWGGRIEWLDAAAHANKVVWRDSRLPVYDFVETRNGLLAIGGLSHLTAQSGGILQVMVSPEMNAKVVPLAELPGDIVAVAVSRAGKLYVLADLSLDRLVRDPDSDIATLGENVFELDRDGRLRLLSCEAD